MIGNSVGGRLAFDRICQSDVAIGDAVDSALVSVVIWELETVVLLVTGVLRDKVRSQVAAEVANE
jgi:hypothetical protein